MARVPCVYILSNRPRGTIYIGVTSNLPGRVWQHRNSLAEGFTKRYGTHRLVWYEVQADMASAILREKRLKEWRREWKIRLVETSNPEWKDLYETLGW